MTLRESTSLDTSPNSSSPIIRSPNTDSAIYICSRRVPIKRIFLPVAGTLGLLSLPLFQTYIYIPVVIFCVSFVLFWNFPNVITFMNSKPLYYEDLFIADAKTPPCTIDLDVRRKFENAFEWSLIFTNSLFTAALSEYWLYQTGSANSYVEMIGVTGGILKIFQSINYMNGGLILNVTKSFINKELDSASELSGTAVELEDVSPSKKNTDATIENDNDTDKDDTVSVSITGMHVLVEEMCNSNDMHSVDDTLHLSEVHKNELHEISGTVEDEFENLENIIT
tara:strand:+ start:1389 stop:2231 length:843 start_codon:yes stop_codon:yes gene_type:complete